MSQTDDTEVTAMPSSPTRTTIPFAVLALVAIASGSLALGAATSRDSVSERIYVTDVGGRVEVSTNGIAYEVEVDSTIALPSRIVTGNDGTLGIKQAETSISVAPDSEIEIPEAAADGQLIARIVQHRGNVFYDVAKREVGRFRVETPYLVAVVKGTQFNVAVGADNTMISLFEGSLEILTPDETDLIQLDAGEIAVRSREDIQIRVLGMDDAGPQAREPELGEVVARTAPAASTQGSVVRIGSTVEVQPPAVANVAVGTESTAKAQSGGVAEVQLGTPGAAHAVGAGSVDHGNHGADVRLDNGLHLGAANASISTETNVDLGGGNVAVGLDAGLLEVDLDVDVELDAELDLGTDAEVDAGEDTVDVGETVEELLDPLPDTLNVPGLLNGSR